jgi:alpha-L-fucosidase
MFTAEMWDAEKLTRMARELQPDILLNNRASVPGDFDTPEQRLGFFQDWRPWESCICLTHSWSYSGGEPKSRDQLIQMLVANACCDGNLLLSWGPQWNGEFAPKEKARLLEVGEWLKENGRAIYGTRGGPWKWSSWGGSTRRDKTAWLHVVKGGKIELPALPGRTVLSAQLLNGQKVDFQQDGKTLTVTVPQASPVSIVELTFDQSVDDIPAIPDAAAHSIFHDASTYGKIVSSEAKVKTGSTSPNVEVDLGREVSVTGVRILNGTKTDQAAIDHAATLHLSISSDGKTWTEVWKSEKILPQWEIPVNDFLAGAEVPGRKARYLRLETKLEKPEPFHLNQVQVYGKE